MGSEGRVTTVKPAMAAEAGLVPWALLHWREFSMTPEMFRAAGIVALRR